MQVEIYFQGDQRLASVFRRLVTGARHRGLQALKEITTEWQREAKLRCPVETGFLRDRILREHGEENGELYGAVGTNVYYGPYVEFGTPRIAGGRVKALGTDAEITDEQAVKDWPAKAKDAAVREQMPWLRPAFMAIRDWALQRLAEAMRQTA